LDAAGYLCEEGNSLDNTIKITDNIYNSGMMAVGELGEQRNILNVLVFIIAVSKIKSIFNI